MKEWILDTKKLSDKDTQPMGSLWKTPAAPGLGRQMPGVRHSIWINHVGGSNLSTWIFTAAS